jgi:hypothetical protein
LILKLSKDKLLEIAFLTGFSVLILALFYSIISMNGLVLGNDGSVHLERAKEFLTTGQISLANLGWTPPLFQILLAFLITFTGATNIDQYILLVKILAVVVNWLMVFSVYLLGARFFNRQTGAVAAVLLLLCFPMFEINMWAGYTSILGIAFMLLLFLYLPLSIEHKGYMIVAGVSAFALVLSHQLTAFVTVLILAPVMLFLIIKSRGRNIKALIVIILGGGIAFFLYYVQAMLPYLGGIIEHVFFAQKAMAYQIPQTTLSAFWINFGFILILGFAGVFVAAYKLWLEKKHVSNLTLLLAFIIPLILAKSYVFGLYLPFQWFVYYFMPPLTILAAVLLFFVGGKSLQYYKTHKASIKRIYVIATVVGIIALLCVGLVMRCDTLNSKIDEAVSFYSTSDPMALQAGQWLKTNYPEQATVVATYVPGFWFSAFSDKNVIAATNPIVERNLVSETITDLSYEIETSLTLIQAYEAKEDITSETYVSVNSVWQLESYGIPEGYSLTYSVDGVAKTVDLSQMTRTYTLDGSQEAQKTLTITYTNDEVCVTQTQQITNSSYATQVIWSVTPLKAQISNVSLYLTTFFDLFFNFNTAYVPGTLDWENPWSNPSATGGTDWASTDFYKTTITDNYIALQDSENQVYYAINFQDMPEWGNIGALASMQIDAIRIRYNSTEQVNPGNSVSFSYQTLTFSEGSYYQTVSHDQVKELFTAQPAWYYTIASRDYIDVIKENNVSFLVYDKNELDPKLVRSSILELVYSNSRYAIFKVTIQ